MLPACCHARISRDLHLKGKCWRCIPAKDQREQTVIYSGMFIKEFRRLLDLNSRDVKDSKSEGLRVKKDRFLTIDEWIILMWCWWVEYYDRWSSWRTDSAVVTAERSCPVSLNGSSKRPGSHLVLLCGWIWRVFESPPAGRAALPEGLQSSFTWREALRTPAWRCREVPEQDAGETVPPSGELEGRTQAAHQNIFIRLMQLKRVDYRNEDRKGKVESNLTLNLQTNQHKRELER